MTMTPTITTTSNFITGMLFGFGLPLQGVASARVIKRQFQLTDLDMLATFLRHPHPVPRFTVLPVPKLLRTTDPHSSQSPTRLLGRRQHYKALLWWQRYRKCPGRCRNGSGLEPVPEGC